VRFYIFSKEMFQSRVIKIITVINNIKNYSRKQLNLKRSSNVIFYISLMLRMQYANIIPISPIRNGNNS
jgi:hypothetical protein